MCFVYILQQTVLAYTAFIDSSF